MFLTQFTGACNTHILPFRFFQLSIIVFTMRICFILRIFLTLDTGIGFYSAVRLSLYLAFGFRITLSKYDFTYVLGYLMEEPVKGKITNY